MNNIKGLVIAVLMILAAPIVGYFLYLEPALNGSWLRWIAPLTMVIVGAVQAGVNWPRNRDAESEPPRAHHN
jgi:cytochrome c-type biogenesis protein CcmH/NrfF